MKKHNCIPGKVRIVSSPTKLWFISDCIVKNCKGVCVKVISNDPMDKIMFSGRYAK